MKLIGLFKITNNIYIEYLSNLSLWHASGYDTDSISISVIIYLTFNTGCRPLKHVRIIPSPLNKYTVT